MIYDRQYRRDALARKDLNWSVLNSRLYNEAFIGRARAIPRCTHCLGDDHAAGSCPLNPSFNIVGVAPSPSPTYRQGGLSEICRNFNSARCRRLQCQYQHLCLVCNGSHPYINCPRRRPLTRPPRGHSPGSSGVHTSSVSMSLPDPREQSSLPLLRRVQVGISRIRLQSGKQMVKVRLPVIVHILQRIHDTWMNSSNPDRVMLWAVAAAAFFGFFRLGELLSDASAWNSATDLAWGDVAVDNHAAPTVQ